jgi:hypothetical protein
MKSYKIEVQFTTNFKCKILYDLGQIKIIIYTTYKQLLKQYGITTDDITAETIKRIKSDNILKNETITNYNKNKSIIKVDGFEIVEDEGQLIITQISTGEIVQIASFKLKDKWKFNKTIFNKLLKQRNKEKESAMAKVQGMILQRREKTE